MNPQELKKLETKILNTLQKHLQTGDTVIAGISGGPDSIFLLHFLKKLPIKIIVAHINHQLRKEAVKDEQFVRDFCENNYQTNPPKKHNASNTNIPKYNPTLIFTSLTSPIKSLSQKSKQGLEETGRKVRYEFFQKLAKKHHAKFIITAHHADDNLETIILNFARGASLQGLAGMAEIEKSENQGKLDQSKSKKSSLLRPLLQISKQQILEYLHHHKIPYCIDKSNDSLIYKRNFIRHKIVPLLKEINPSITKTLAENTKNLTEINDYLDSQAQDWIKKNRLDSTMKKFPKKAFLTQPQTLKKIILLKIYEHLIGNTQNLKSVNLDEALTLIQNNIGNKKKKFGQITIILKNNIFQIEN